MKQTIPATSSQDYVKAVLSKVSSSEQDPRYLLELANLTLRQMALNEGLKILQQVNKLDKRSFYQKNFSALVYETIGKNNQAISFREQMLELDPLSTANMTQLIKDYLAVGNKSSASSIAAKIKENYPGSQADIDAAALLVAPVTPQP